MKITLDGVMIEAKGTYREAIQAAQPERAERVLAVRVGGATVPLGANPKEGDVAETLVYEMTEGRRVYERSLRFVFLLAVKQVLPRARVRLEHSFDRGIYINIFDTSALTGRTVSAIERRMHEIVAADLPFEETVVTKQEAIEYFREIGQQDKVRLLAHHAHETFRLYQCGDMKEYFYGAMTPSTGFVGVFSLQLYLPGLMLILPDPKDARRVAPFRDLPKLMQTYVESARWASILHCSNAADLNEMSATGQLREFIRVNEALHEKSVGDIADRFVLSGARVILIAGPSSSGKTTFANRLAIALRVLGLRPTKLSLDDYYLDRDLIPVDENGERDFERLDTLDVPLFNEHLVRLLQGERVDTPIFDFTRGSRSEQTKPMQVDMDQPILIEGIHGLNDQLTGDIARRLKYQIYVSALTALNLDDHNRIRTTDARLLRRMVRDHQFRNTPLERTLSMWQSVRRGEENYIFPFQEQADVMFNSSLVYEMAVLKKYIYPLLLKVSPDSPHFASVDRLVKFLDYFRSADVEDEIPPNSILREFIGGSCFYRCE